MDRNINLPNVDGVYFNDYQGIYEATKALIGAGHTKIGIINADLEKPLARDRQKGFTEAMEQAGIAYATDQIIDLVANGVRHIHLYTMNRPKTAAKILENLSHILR